MKDYTEVMNYYKDFFGKRKEEIEKFWLAINACRGLKMGFLKAMIETFGDEFEFEMVSDTVFRMDKKGKKRKNARCINQAEFLSLFKKDTPSV